MPGQRPAVLNCANASAAGSHHTIHVKQLRATVDVHIHYSFELADADERHTNINRWLVLDVTMPIIFRPIRRTITSAFDKENVRTMTAVKQYAEAHAGLNPA